MPNKKKLTKRAGNENERSKKPANAKSSWMKAKPTLAPLGHSQTRPEARKLKPSRAKSAPQKTMRKRELTRDAIVPNADAEEASAEGERPRRRRRVALGEAMRKHGLDEHAIAQTYAGVVKTLSKKKTGEGTEKLLVDVLKECSRVLEPPLSKERAGERGSSNAPVAVHLSHNVPRPVRNRDTSET